MTNKFLAGVSLWYASLNFTRDITVDYIGVPFNLLVACFIGAICSFSVGTRVEPRSKMWGLLAACLFMGAAFTAVTNAAIEYFMELNMTPAAQAGMGCIVSFVTRFFLPWLADVVAHGKWLAWIPFIRNRSDNP